METRTVDARFMSAGPSMSLALPIELDVADTEVACPLYIRPSVARMYVYATGRLEKLHTEGFHANYAYEGDFDGPAGSMQLWRRVDDDGWGLIWILPEGVLTSHLRSQDGTDGVAELARSIDMDISKGLAPLLLPANGVKIGVQARPPYQDSLRFFDDVRSPKLTVSLLRPGVLGSGAHRDLGDRYVTGSLAGLDVEVIGWGDSNGSIAQLVIDSLSWH